LPTPAPGRCCAPKRRRSTCWCLPGLWTAIKRTYNPFIFEQIEHGMAGIEIYTRPGCGYCTAAKSLLSRKNAPFKELSVSADPGYREQMYQRAGAGVTFPQIFVGNTHVGGCGEPYPARR